MQGALREELYAFPASLRPERAISEASRRVLSLSPASRASAADITIWMAMEYAAAPSRSCDSSLVRDDFMSASMRVSDLSTTRRNISADRAGPLSATLRTATSSEPPFPITTVIIPTTSGPSFRRGGTFMSRAVRTFFSVRRPVLCTLSWIICRHPVPYRSRCGPSS